MILILVRQKTWKGMPGNVTSRNKGTEVSEGILLSWQLGKANVVHYVLSVPWMRRWRGENPVTGLGPQPPLTVGVARSELSFPHTRVLSVFVLTSVMQQ